MNYISVEVDDFKDANEALGNRVEVCSDEKVKTEPSSISSGSVLNFHHYKPRLDYTRLHWHPRNHQLQQIYNSCPY